MMMFLKSPSARLKRSSDHPLCNIPGLRSGNGREIHQAAKSTEVQNGTHKMMTPTNYPSLRRRRSSSPLIMNRTRLQVPPGSPILRDGR